MAKLAVTLIVVAAAMVAGVAAFGGAAQASRSLSLAPAGGFLFVSLGLLSFRSTLGGIPVDITCLLTLHGSLSRIVPKRAGTQFGSVTAASVVSPCNPTLTRTTLLSIPTPSLPWNLNYITYLGLLPNPNGISFIVRAFTRNLIISGVTPESGCNYRGDVPMLAGFRGSAPNTATLVTVQRHTVPLISSEAGCPASKQFIGSFALTPAQTLILVN